MRTKKAPSRSKCHLWSQNFTGELTYSCCTACNLQTYARKNLQGTIYTYKAYFGQHYNTKTNNENKSEKIPINAHKGANKKLSSSLPFFRQIWSHFSPKIWKPYPMGKETQAGFSVRRNNLKRKPTKQVLGSWFIVSVHSVQKYVARAHWEVSGIYVDKLDLITF